MIQDLIKSSKVYINHLLNINISGDDLYSGDEIFSTVIFSLQLIQGEHLSVSGKELCTSTGYPLKGLSLPR